MPHSSDTHPLFLNYVVKLKSTLKLSLKLIKHQMTNIIVNHNINGVYCVMGFYYKYKENVIRIYEFI